MEKRMEELSKTLDVNGLRDLWKKTQTMEDTDGKYILRVIVMDRLEEYNPEAFDLWLDQADELDFSVFKNKK